MLLDAIRIVRRIRPDAEGVEEVFGDARRGEGIGPRTSGHRDEPWVGLKAPREPRGWRGEVPWAHRTDRVVGRHVR